MAFGQVVFAWSVKVTVLLPPCVGRRAERRLRTMQGRLTLQETVRLARDAAESAVRPAA
ncbi:hypothetical protein [Streptomyces sp. IBSBF 2950]|uniref:hypothetical protein n=1 Tax=Streptomyces sp. IBSBF 2950 TaxID=2903528 RepID=UPI002FDC36DF